MVARPPVDQARKLRLQTSSPTGSQARRCPAPNTLLALLSEQPQHGGPSEHTANGGRGRRIHPQLHPQRQYQHPQEIGVALHPLPRVPHKAVTIYQVASIAKADVGVVTGVLKYQHTRRIEQ